MESSEEVDDATLFWTKFTALVGSLSNIITSINSISEIKQAKTVLSEINNSLTLHAKSLPL